jgi:hypothetical protein
MFDAGQAYARSHTVGIPNKTVNVPHLGTEAFAAENGSAITVLFGKVQLELGNGQGAIKTTEKQMVTLAKKIL